MQDSGDDVCRFVKFSSEEVGWITQDLRSGSNEANDTIMLDLGLYLVLLCSSWWCDRFGTRPVVNRKTGVEQVLVYRECRTPVSRIGDVCRSVCLSDWNRCVGTSGPSFHVPFVV